MRTWHVGSPPWGATSPCARRTEQLDTLAAGLRANHPGIEVVTSALNVTEYDSVFSVLAGFRSRLGRLDRVIVNAGIGKGAAIGTGYFYANRQTLETNAVAGLAQAEAAVQIFREQFHGHLVLMSSVSALRGFAGSMTAYAASKAAVSALAEGIRVDTRDTPITVSTLMPGYIQSEMTDMVGRTPLLTGARQGTRSLVRAIEREPATAYVPFLPWALVASVLRRAPLGLLRRVS